MTEQRLVRIAWLARLALAVVFIWHGLVPKILWLSPDEVAMIEAHGLSDQPWFAPHFIAALGGVAEILLGIALLTVRRQRWPLLVAGVVLLALLLDVVLVSPHLLLQAFNPLSTNLAALALCAVAWLAEAPSADTRDLP